MTPPIPREDTALLMIDVQNAFLHPKGMSARLAGGTLPAPEIIDEPMPADDDHRVPKNRYDALMFGHLVTSDDVVAAYASVGAAA
ncbi:MAG TPA: hypothetical protein VGM91_06505 [Conexibacter sp.]|jgi:nicotinamidase-related amidase